MKYVGEWGALKCLIMQQYVDGAQAAAVMVAGIDVKYVGEWGKQFLAESQNQITMIRYARLSIRPMLNCVPRLSRARRSTRTRPRLIRVRHPIHPP